jgi:hypothetical protein
MNGTKMLHMEQKPPTLHEMKQFDKKKNESERMKFVELWAEYVRTHSDKEWSRQQKIVVDSQLRSLVPKKS